MIFYFFIIVIIFFREMFGFHSLSIFCPSQYKICANSPFNSKFAKKKKKRVLKSGITNLFFLTYMRPHTYIYILTCPHNRREKIRTIALHEIAIFDI